MEQQIYISKELKKWGNSYVIRFTPEEIKISKLKLGDVLKGILNIEHSQIDSQPSTTKGGPEPMPQDNDEEDEEEGDVIEDSIAEESDEE